MGGIKAQIQSCIVMFYHRCIADSGTAWTRQAAQEGIFCSPLKQFMHAEEDGSHLHAELTGSCPGRSSLCKYRSVLSILAGCSCGPRIVAFSRWKDITYHTTPWAWQIKSNVLDVRSAANANLLRDILWPLFAKKERTRHHEETASTRPPRISYIPR